MRKGGEYENGRKSSWMVIIVDLEGLKDLEDLEVLEVIVVYG